MTLIQRTTSLLLAAGAGASLWGQNIICSGAELYAKPNQAVKYGRWEIRMQAAATPGSVSSFFTYFDSSYISGKPWREIDIEVLGNQPTGFQSNVILVANDNSHKGFHTQTVDVNKGFHTYSLVWTPDSVVWRLDGVLQRKETNKTVLTKLQEKTQTYRMNLWSSTSEAWVGALDLSKLPVYQVVNWMRYSAYTPGAGPNGSNFTESWVDDFNSFNSARWAKGDWTFDQNQAQLTPTNLSVRDGYLVLALTRPDQEGIKQSFPKDPTGNTYTSSSLTSRTATPALRAWATPTGIGIEGAAAGVQVHDAHGRLLAQALPGVSRVDVQERGVLIVRSGEVSRTVVR